MLRHSTGQSSIDKIGKPGWPQLCICPVKQKETNGLLLPRRWGKGGAGGSNPQELPSLTEEMLLQCRSCFRAFKT